jgi:hypothetical protein
MMLSCWFVDVLSAMGFYPVCPGSPIYEIGSPIFTQTRLTLRAGRNIGPDYGACSEQAMGQLAGCCTPIDVGIPVTRGRNALSGPL